LPENVGRGLGSTSRAASSTLTGRGVEYSSHRLFVRVSHRWRESLETGGAVQSSTAAAERLLAGLRFLVARSVACEPLAALNTFPRAETRYADGALF